MDGTFEKRKKLIYEFICDDFYIPMKQKEMAALLQVSKEQRRELKEVLDSLVDEGKIYVSKKGKYCKGEAQTLIGVYQAHPRGFGFVTVEGREEDIFIGEDDTGGAFHGDTVEVTEDAQLVINGSYVAESDIYYSTPRYESEVTYPVELEENQVFILCDYREGARDSRYFGPVEESEIKGKVITIIRRSEL